MSMSMRETTPRPVRCLLEADQPRHTGRRAVGVLLESAAVAVATYVVVVLAAAALGALLVFVFGCAFTGGGYGVEATWTIADGQVNCENTDGYPTGADCVASGAEAIESIAEKAAGAHDPDLEHEED